MFLALFSLAFGKRKKGMSKNFRACGAKTKKGFGVFYCGVFKIKMVLE
jgi:hypothetical protein